MPFILFVVAVIAVGVLTIKLKRRNRKIRQDAWEELGAKLLKSEPVPEVSQPVSGPAQAPDDSQPEQIYVPQPEQDLATLVIPESLPFAEELRILKYMAEKYPEEIQLCFYAPASSTTISLFEQRLGIRLPDELRAMYSFANGMDLCGMTLSFDNLQMIEALYKQGYSYWREEGDEQDYIAIGSVIGDGECIILEKKTGNLLWYDEGDITDYRDVTGLLNWLIEFEFDGYICNDDPVIKGYLHK